MFSDALPILISSAEWQSSPQQPALCPSHIYTKVWRERHLERCPRQELTAVWSLGFWGGEAIPLTFVDIIDSQLDNLPDYHTMKCCSSIFFRSCFVTVLYYLSFVGIKSEIFNIYLCIYLIQQSSGSRPSTWKNIEWKNYIKCLNYLEQDSLASLFLLQYWLEQLYINVNLTNSV